VGVLLSFVVRYYGFAKLVGSECLKLTNPLDAPDLPLLEGESPDLRQEAIAIFGEAWLMRPNLRLGGPAPLEMIQKERGARVRDLIRTAKYIGVS
jgi:hypothetical protein